MHLHIYVQINERAARRTPYANLAQAHQKDPSGAFYGLWVTHAASAPLAQPLSALVPL